MLVGLSWRKLALGIGIGLTAGALSVTTALADTATPTPSATPTGVIGTATPTIIIGTATPTVSGTVGTSTPTATGTTGTGTPTATGSPVTGTPTGTPIAPTVTPTATSSVPHDSRYFSQTSFRIDNDTIWDYFNRRGGLTTFGYPVSRTFVLQGFTVQFFQRRIVQLDGGGHARLLNVLDSGLMPYNSFNGATFPALDAGLVASVPPPSDAVGVLNFVKTHAPDAFETLPVNFYQVFLNTVSAAVAFPAGGDSSLLPGFNLEMWGVPTSGAMYDPNNHNFVYQRFQRGIMHFDAGCRCTQGILLVDYFKSILTGQNLPSDVDQESQGSIFYKQYDPTQPQWVHNANVLTSTDLTNAFTAE